MASELQKHEHKTFLMKTLICTQCVEVCATSLCNQPNPFHNLKFKTNNSQKACLRTRKMDETKNLAIAALAPLPPRVLQHALVSHLGTRCQPAKWHILRFKLERFQQNPLRQQAEALPK